MIDNIYLTFIVGLVGNTTYNISIYYLPKGNIFCGINFTIRYLLSKFMYIII